MNFQSDGKLVACFSTLLLKIKDTAPLDQIVPTIHQIVPRNHQILLRNHWIVPRDHQIVPSSIKLYLKTIKVNSNCTNKNIKLRTLYPIILTHLKIGVLFLSSKKGWVITKAVLFSRLKKKKWFSRLRCSLFVAKPICVAKKSFSGLKFFFFEAKNRSCINMSIHLPFSRKNAMTWRFQTILMKKTL